jgi:hypothetical protein
MTYETADFAAFAPFVMQSPCFLPHQRRPKIGQGRSDCQTLSGCRRNASGVK